MSWMFHSTVLEIVGYKILYIYTHTHFIPTFFLVRKCQYEGQVVI